MGRVIITKKQGGLGRKALTEDMITGLVMSGIAVSGGAQLNTVYPLISVADAEALGLDAAYDTANDVLVFYHIKEFFRICPDGKLFILLVSQATTLTQMCDVTSANGVAKLLRSAEAEGKIKQWGVARNPATGYTPTLSGGLDEDVIKLDTGVYTGAVIKGQALCVAEEALHRPVIGVVEGRSLNGSVASVIDLRGANCPNIAVVIAADKDVSARDTLQNGYAAVGTALGMIAKRAVNECIGFVADSNIQDGATGDFVKPALSSNTLLTGYSQTELDALDTKGFVTAITYIGYPGVYFQDSHTAVATTSDYATIENNRTINKAIRLVYTRLVPYINSTVQVDPNNGKLAPSVCKFYEQEAVSALQGMLTDGEVSGLDAYVNPDQNILSTSELVVEIEIVLNGVARKIRVPIGFKNPFNL